MSSPPHLFLLVSLFILFSTIAADSFHPRGFLGRFSNPDKPTVRGQLRQYKYETRYFSQLLDHFGFSSETRFDQRYLISTEHWLGTERKGPVFVYCGNEGDIEWFAANSGFVWEVAERVGALVVFPEHRYYGKSMPYGSGEQASKNASTLGYLTAEQALADFAVLITDLKKNFSAESCPVVLFGGSYGGMLAAWMRLKYPNIAIGALASSAPILQFEDIVPPETFYNLVSHDFKRESVSCFNTIKQSWDALSAQGQMEDGLPQLSQKFRLCRELSSVDVLSNWLESAYSYLAMVDYPYPSDFMMPLPGNPIKEVCKRIDSAPDGSSILDRIFDGVSVYYNYTGSVKCFDLDDDPHGMNGWNFQACTEMVMPMSSSKDNSMFRTYDYNYAAFEEWCRTSFGVKPRPTWISTQFGGHNIYTVLKHYGSNIIFSNGLLDPWSGGGVLKNISDTIVAIVTEEGAHHIDLRASTPNDPDWLVQFRESEIRIIQGWLNDYYQDLGRTTAFSSM